MTSHEALRSGKNLELKGFALYLRTGIQFSDQEIEAAWEKKFNPYHDPADGQFTFAPGNTDGARMAATPKQSAADPRVRRSNTPHSHVQQTPRQSPQQRTPHSEIGNLSAKYESRPGTHPGTISSGRADPGGVSYGSYQLSSSKGTVDAFLRSRDAAPWNRKFQGLRPATAAFDAQWRAIAAHEPAAFQAAQQRFIGRSHYEPAVNSVKRRTGYDLNGASEAVRQATYSVSVQYGRAEKILSEAVKLADSSFQRTDPDYQAALINRIYDSRIAYVERQRQIAIRERRHGDAHTLRNVISIRYPRERADALRLLSGK